MKLAEWRRENRLTQAEVGTRLGVSSLLVSQWETGRRRPGESNLQAIADLTGSAVLPNDFYDLPSRPSETSEAA